MITFAAVLLGSFILHSQFGIATDDRGNKKTRQAKAEINELVTAFDAYWASYQRYPAPYPPDLGTTNDVTFGAQSIFGNESNAPDNSAIFAILSGQYTNYAGFENGETNWNPNPLGKQFFPAKRTKKIGQPGLGPDGVYRDPWGNPYIITIDIDGDGQCADAMYRRQVVSLIKGNEGFKGLVRPNGKSGDNFLFPREVMIWSMGPDGVADPNLPADQNDPVTGKGNLDNILFW